MKYLVTFATTDGTLGNPFWHSFLLLSTLDEDTGNISVVDNWGFYGVPSTSKKTFISSLKVKIGLDIDLTGNHGLLKHEELRFLDLGRGLHGISFELTKEKFEQLQKKCINQEENQKQAIKDYTKGIKGKSPRSTRLYPQEQYSQMIYALEKARAQESDEKPRLKPFEIRMDWTLWGPSFKHSFTCKSMAIELLQGIIPEEHIALLTENGEHPTIPKYSGPQETIYLSSSGPFRQHKKRSGEVVNYRDFNDEGVSLQWSLPPQQIITLSEETKAMLRVNPNYVKDIKSLIGKLQQLEWLFINAKLDSKLESYRYHLIQRIRERYLSFASQNTSSSSYYRTSNHASVNAFFASRSNDDMSLANKILNSKLYLTMLAKVVSDNRQINDNLPSEVDLTDDAIDGQQYNILEQLAAHMTKDDQKSLIKIIGHISIKSKAQPKLSEQEANYESLAFIR